MPQVLICGAGPTGLTLASLLHERGVSVRVIDRAAPRPAFESRAIGTHARALSVFERLGVAGEMLDLGLRWRGFNFHANGRQIGRFSFEMVDAAHKFPLILPQAETERILREHLTRLGVAVEHETELIDFAPAADAIVSTVRRADGAVEQIESAFLVGADGARSRTRELLGLDFAGRRLQGSYLMDCRVDWRQTPLTEGNTFFADGWRLIVGQLPAERYRVVVNLPHDDARMKFETPSVELMQSFVDCFGLKMRLENPSWASAFWLSVRRAERMRVGRVFLAGDASHNVCPNAGQGMNAGIHDAVCLADKLAAFLQTGADNLDAYERLRMPVINKLLSASERMENLMTLSDGLAARARNFFLPFVSRSKFVQRKISNQIAGVHVKLER